MSANNAQALLAKLKRQQEETAAIQQYWAALFPDLGCVSASQIRVWTTMYDFDCVVYGLDTALKQQNRRDQEVAEHKKGVTPMKALDIIKYASGVMKRHQANEEDKDAVSATVTEGQRLAYGDGYMEQVERTREREQFKREHPGREVPEHLKINGLDVAEAE